MYDWPQIDNNTLRRHRLEQTVGLMDHLNIDHLLLTGFDNIRYVTDYRTLIIAEAYDWFAAIADSAGESEIFVPWVDETVKDPDPALPGIRALHPLPSWTPASPHAGYWAPTISKVLGDRGARRVGYELMSADLLQAIAERLPGVEFVPIATELYDLRLQKHPLEIELIAAACAVNSRAADRAIDSAKQGMTDNDVLAEAMSTLQHNGVEFLSHSLCNVRRGSGTWFAVGNELHTGDAFFFDIGCYGPGGYASDMARTGFVGEPPTSVANAYRRLLQALHIGEEAARPGIHASEIHNTINAELQRHRLPITPYSIGHGVGLRACELPTIHRSDRMGRDQVLREGMVISLEPETGVEVGGQFVLLKVEDNYVVEATGLRRLTDAQYTAFAD